METLSIALDDGLLLPVKRCGMGPALIIQHGWTGSVLDWVPPMRELRQHFSVHCWDMRPYLGEDNEIERMARDLDRVIQTLEIEHPIVLGHSMGALVCWEYIRQRGCDALGGLVIVDQSPKVITDEDWSLGLYGRFTAVDNAALLQAFERDFIRTVLELVANGKKLTEADKHAPAWTQMMVMRLQRLKTLDPKPWLTAWRSFVIQDYRPVLSKITVPTLLLYGGRSNFYGPRVARYVSDNIAGAILKLYPDAGHSPHVEDPRQVAADLVAFANAIT